MSGIVFGRMYPNAGYNARYRREIRRLIRAMHKDVKRELGALYSVLATDAPLTLTEIMSRLRKKWYYLFEKRAKEMAKWLADSVQKRTQKDVMNQLKKMGFALTPHYTGAEKKMISDFVKDSVKWIKTIPQTFLKEVQESVRTAFEKGGDRAAIKAYVENKFDHPLVNRKPGESLEDAERRAERRAELIAKDQTQKVTQDFARANAQAYGATKARWIHIPGEKTSRITHMEMDGEEFDINVGLYDPDVGEYVKPGQLIYCMCTQEFLFPGTE